MFVFVVGWLIVVLLWVGDGGVFVIVVGVIG